MRHEEQSEERTEERNIRQKRGQHRKIIVEKR
jgi:hypothetical protein